MRKTTYLHEQEMVQKEVVIFVLVRWHKPIRECLSCSADMIWKQNKRMRTKLHFYEQDKKEI